MSSRPWDRGASRKHILDAIEGSLRRLRTDYVDLYQIHHPDRNADGRDACAALDDVVRAGKARYVGLLELPRVPGARALGRSEALGLARFDSVQPRYNLLLPPDERELLPLCEEEASVSSLQSAGGSFLSGKHQRDAGPPGHALHARHRGRSLPGAVLARARVRHGGALRPLAAAAGMSMAQMAWPGCWRIRPSRRPLSARAGPISSDDVLAAVDKELAGDLKEVLHELTLEYRFATIPDDRDPDPLATIRSEED